MDSVKFMAILQDVMAVMTKAYREQRQLTQADLADELGIPQ